MSTAPCRAVPPAAFLAAPPADCRPRPHVSCDTPPCRALPPAPTATRRCPTAQTRPPATSRATQTPAHPASAANSARSETATPRDPAAERRTFCVASITPRALADRTLTSVAFRPVSRSTTVMYSGKPGSFGSDALGSLVAAGPDAAESADRDTAGAELGRLSVAGCEVGGGELSHAPSPATAPANSNMPHRRARKPRSLPFARQSVPHHAIIRRLRRTRRSRIVPVRREKVALRPELHCVACPACYTL